jgi:hypothetical protein
VLAHLARDVSQDLVAVGQLYAEHCVWKSFHNRAFNLDYTVFACHTLTYLLWLYLPGFSVFRARNTQQTSQGIFV